MGGVLTQKTSGQSFSAWLKICACPFALMTSWKEMGNNMVHLQEEAGAAWINETPLHVYVIATTRAAFQSASSWAACHPHWNIRVGWSMTEADVQAWLSLVVSSLCAASGQCLTDLYTSQSSARHSEYESFIDPVAASELSCQSPPYNAAPQAADLCEVASNTWAVVWCCQLAYKEEMKDTHRMLERVVKSGDGCLIRKRSAHMFKAHWLDMHTCPYTLIVGWEHMKNCLTAIEKEVALGNIFKKPAKVYVVAPTESCFGKATYFASKFPLWSIEVVSKLTRVHARTVVERMLSAQNEILDDCPVSLTTVAIDTKPSIADGYHDAGEVGAGHDVKQLFDKHFSLNSYLSSEHEIIHRTIATEIPLDHALSQMARSCPGHDILSLSL